MTPVRRLACPLAPLLVAVVLTACATQRPARDPTFVSGRLSVRVDAAGSQPVQTLSAAFELQGDGDSGELRLNSPLGTRVASARWTPGSAVLASGDGEQRFATLDDLSRRALGETVPLAAFPDWLAGRPWPGAPHQTSAQGFEQLGWQVQLARRPEGFIEAHRTAPPAVLVRVRLDDVAVP